MASVRRAALAAVAIACHLACGTGTDAPPAGGSRGAGTETALPATAIAAGGSRHFASFSHVCAVVAQGLQCWGAGESGQLGDGLFSRRSPRPLRAIAAGSGVTEVSVGGAHSCAVVRGEVLCWGGNFEGQVGVKRPYIAVAPTQVTGLEGPVVRISAGVDHTCASVRSSVWCWGSNSDGQAGRPKCERRSRLDDCGVDPAPVAGIAGEIADLASGRVHTCAATAEGVLCWGDNRRGQLGDGTTQGHWDPRPVLGLPGDVRALAAGEDHTCAVAAGRVYCWGANESGQLGDGTREDRLEAVAIAGLHPPVTAIAAGGDQTCAIAEAAILCWGAGAELRGEPEESLRPTVVRGFPGRGRALAVGADDACVLADDGSVWCWGDNDFGQLGSGDAPLDHAIPVPVESWDDGLLRDRDGDGRIAIACLGDSNTAVSDDTPPAWCERLADLAPTEGWAFVNRGEGGATAVEQNSLITAAEHLDYAIENDAVDAVIFAYGTNDLKISHADPVEVAWAYAHLRQRAQAAGVDSFAALTPPVRSGIGGVDAEISELNAQLANFFPASRLIDFASGMEPTDFVDEVHLSGSGQAKRARAAWGVLSAAAGLAGAP